MQDLKRGGLKGPYSGEFSGFKCQIFLNVNIMILSQGFFHYRSQIYLYWKPDIQIPWGVRTFAVLLYFIRLLYYTQIYLLHTYMKFRLYLCIIIKYLCILCIEIKYNYLLNLDIVVLILSVQIYFGITFLYIKYLLGFFQILLLTSPWNTFTKFENAI